MWTAGCLSSVAFDRRRASNYSSGIDKVGNRYDKRTHADHAGGVDLGAQEIGLHS